MGHGVEQLAHEITAPEMRVILQKRDPFIIEVGCNDGETTCLFLDEMSGATIACFEPDPRPLDRFLLRNDPRVTLFRCAISDRNGKATFHQSGGEVPHSRAPCRADWDYSGSLHVPTGHLERDKVVTFPTTIEVETRRLDDVPLGWPVIDLVFADIQGAEARLILGGQETLRRTRWLYIEFYDVEQYERQPDLKALLAFLPDWNLAALFNDNALFRNRAYL